LEILDVNIDDQFKFDNHVSEVSRKVSQQIVVFEISSLWEVLRKEINCLPPRDTPLSIISVVTVLEFSFVIASVRLRARFSGSCKDNLLSILPPWGKRVAVQDVNFSEPNIPSENPQKIALDLCTTTLKSCLPK